MWSGSTVKPLTLPFTWSAYSRVQRWNKMSDPGVENTSMYWPVDSVTRLPSVLFWTERPLCALALQRFTRAAEKKQKEKHLLKTNPTAASWSWTCLQPRPNKGAGFKNIQWIKQRKQRKEVSHLTWRGPTWFASRYYGPNQDCSTITPVFLRVVHSTLLAMALLHGTPHVSRDTGL